MLHYRCACYAVSPKMLAKLADAGGPAAKEAHQRNRELSARMRTQRHAAPAAGGAAPPSPVPPAASGAVPQKRVFDAQMQNDLPGKLVRADGKPPSKDKAANEVWDNTGSVLDFYRTVFQRNSVDGHGMGIDSSVHVANAYPNAMWDGQQMVFGDGDETVSGFTGALDIIAHEMTHGVIQHVIPKGLGVVEVPVAKRQHAFEKYALKGQGGALNESFADIFGCMARQWKAKQDVEAASWLMGEHLLAPGLGKAMRSLKEPGNRKITWSGDDQVADMRHYVPDGDVHDNSGIPSHAFYFAASAIGGKSWEKAGPIWYRALGMLAADAGFTQAAQATVKAATALYGAASPECRAVADGWKKVNVPL